MKSVLITGANQGIGFEPALQLARLNYQVFLGSRDKGNGLEAIKKMKSLGLMNEDFIEIDVTDIQSIKLARNKLENDLQQLDVLINNA